MNLIKIVAQKTNTSPDDWFELDGPSSGVGVEAYFKNKYTDEECYICVDQGEVISFEIMKN